MLPGMAFPEVVLRFGLNDTVRTSAPATLAPVDFDSHLLPGACGLPG
jgi:hypothetical protein